MALGQEAKMTPLPFLPHAPFRRWLIHTPVASQHDIFVVEPAQDVAVLISAPYMRPVHQCCHF